MSDATPATAMAVTALAAFAGAAVGTWLLKGSPPALVGVVPLPAPGPSQALPGPCDAAFAVLTADPNMAAQEAVETAYAMAFPQCVATAAASECVGGYTAVKECVEALLKKPAKVVVKAPPNACDPLLTPPPGFVCVPAGEQFVLAPQAKEAEVSFVDAVGANEVRATSDYETVRAGSTWPIQTFDVWLEARRVAGELATAHQSFAGGVLVTGLPYFQWGALEWPGSEALYDATTAATNFERASRRSAASASAASALRDFATTHFVQTPAGTLRIIDLPLTQAVHNFRMGLVAYVANFQKRTFPEA